MESIITLETTMEIAAKSSAVILLSALIVILIRRRASAATRHNIWAFGLYSALVIPVFVLVVPGWGVLPSLFGDSPVSNAPASEVAIDFNNGAKFGISPEAPGAIAPVSVLAGDTGEILPVIDGNGLSVSGWLAGLWGAGLVLMLGRVGMSWWSLARLGGNGVRVIDGKMKEVFDEVLEQTAVIGDVRLLTSEARVMPMTWGIFSRTILLPDDAADWGRGRLRSVLLHELAHLERRDPLHRLVAQIACAVHWFNPLVWTAAWRQQVESEDACDDRVLEAGIRGSDYASHLLGVVARSGFAPAGGGLATAMARSRSQLERRVAAVIDPRRNRRRVSRAAFVGSLALALGLVIPVSVLTAAEPGEGDGERKVEEEEPKPDVGGEVEKEETLPEGYFWKSLIANRERMLRLVKTEYEAGRAGIDEVFSAEAEVHDSELGLARFRGDRDGESGALRSKVEVATQRLELVKRLYRNGSAAETEVLAREAELLRAQMELKEAKSKADTGVDEAKPKAEAAPDEGAPDGGLPAKPEDVYFSGFLLFREAEGLIDEGKNLEGLAKLKEAREQFRSVGERWPTWQRQIVDFRLNLIESEISRLADEGEDGPGEIVGATEQSVAGHERLVKLMRKQFEEGLTSAVELARAEANLARAKNWSARSKGDYLAGMPDNLYERKGGEIVEASAKDLAVARGYRDFEDKGKLRGGRRITIMTAKTRYKAGEEIRVIHVLEATASGIEISNVGPKRVSEEYVDGELVSPPRGSVIETVRGSSKESPGVDFLYEITSYSFDGPGEHTIQWKGGGLASEGDLGLESNELRIVVEN